jgi:hypothetical protein
VAALLASAVGVFAASFAMAETIPTSPPPLPAAPTPAPAPAPPGQLTNPAAPLAAPSPPPTDQSQFASADLLSAQSTSNAIAPYMIGDFFAGNGQIVFVPKISANSGRVVVGQIPAAGGTGRAKISDDNSVFPEDRVFFLYNYFDNAILVPAPSPHVLDINRYTPGFEKTFFDRNASIELRIPFANTQNSDVYLAGGKDEDVEFGNLEATLKFLIWRDSTWAFATGVGFNMPTAADTKVFPVAAMQPLFTIENDAFHVQPYFGALWTPDDRWFVQAFAQFDLDANGNHVQQLNVGDVGVLYDQDLFQVDIQAGFWWYRNPQARYLTGVAPTIEYHYTTTIQDASIVAAGVRGGEYFFGNTANRLDIQNLTVGLELFIGPRSTLNIAGVLPLNRPNSADRQFDQEIFVQFNRFF